MNVNRYLIVVVSILFALVLLARPEPCSADAGNGDISGNGTLTITDQNMLRDYMLGKIPLTTTQKASADLNGDAKVDVADMVKMIAKKPVSQTIVKVGSIGGDAVADGLTVTLPAGLITTTAATTVTLAIQPQPPVLGEDLVGHTVQISIPIASINCAQLARDAQAVIQRRANMPQTYGYVTKQSASDLVVKLGNVWQSTVGSFYVAAKYTIDANSHAWQIVGVTAVDTAKVTAHMTADAFNAAVTAAVKAGKKTVEITFTVIHETEDMINKAQSLVHLRHDIIGYSPALLDFSDPTTDDASIELQAKKNIVIFVHGIVSNYGIWQQDIRGLLGDNGSSPDPVLALPSGATIGAWVYEFNYKRSTQANGVDLDDLIENYVKAHSGQIDNIYFVAHSQGGLIVRHALNAAKNNNREWLKKVRATAYLGSMHAGTSLYLVGTQIINQCAAESENFREKAIFDFIGLYLNTPGMQDLGTDIPASVGVPDSSRNVRTYLIGTDKPSKHTSGLFTEANDGWVQLTSVLDNSASRDYPSLSDANKKTWPNDKDPMLHMDSAWGGHVLLHPNDGDGGVGRLAAAVRTDARYKTLRDFLFPSSGFITVDVTPDTATWKLTGPAGFTAIDGAGDRLGVNAITNAPSGNYTLHCNALTGYTPPADQVETLTNGGALIYIPVYSTSGQLSISGGGGTSGNFVRANNTLAHLNYPLSSTTAKISMTEGEGHITSIDWGGLDQAANSANGYGENAPRICIGSLNSYASTDDTNSQLCNLPAITKAEQTIYFYFPSKCPSSNGVSAFNRTANWIVKLTEAGGSSQFLILNFNDSNGTNLLGL